MSFTFPKDMHLGIAMPLSWSYIHSDTYLSLMSMYRPQNLTILQSPRGGDIAEKREMQSAAAVGMGMTHVVYLDGDMVFPQRCLLDMTEVLETKGADLAGVLCFRGYPPYDPLIWHKEEDRLMKPFKEYKFGDLVEAGATGAACLMVKIEVLKSLPRPWFQVLEKKEGETTIKRGEDVYFTRKATDSGFKLKIITEYDVGHLRNIRIDRDFWASYLLIARVVKKDGWKGVFELIKKT